MKKTKLSLGLILLLIFSLVVVGCGSKEPAQPDEPLNEENAGEEEQGTVEEPKLGGSIILSHLHRKQWTLDFILPILRKNRHRSKSGSSRNG